MSKYPKTTKEVPIIMYQTEDGQTKMEVMFDGDTVWLTQEKMAELFQRSKSTVNEHLKNIFSEGELVEGDVIIKFGNSEFNKDHKKPTNFYNLDAILAVGYRVKSHRGIHFRKWASGILKEYMRKGFAMNDDLLKQAGGGQYFKELLNRIRDIRASEKVFYRQVLDLFATSVDYDPKSEIAGDFFAKMQNMLYYSVTKQTAAEMIAKRANAYDPFMGLMAFKGERPTKAEVTVAKNYLGEKEGKELRLMVSAYLDVAEMIANEERLMYMIDWAKELEDFILYRKKPVLKHAGSIEKTEANERALEQYRIYRSRNGTELTQVERDFLETVKRTYALLEGKKKDGEEGEE
ncbi:MAG: virulence RhuM family protein [Defluviitaleaceae bacterium]|nr:virulence RhuM family protein [Defluviitaleaceae bacterium]